MVEGICIGLLRRVSFFDTNEESFTADGVDFIENPVGGDTQLAILGDVLNGIKRGTFLFPLGRVACGAIDFPFEQVAFALIEPCSEMADLIQGDQVSGEAEDGAFFIFWVSFGDERADMAEFVQVDHVNQRNLKKHESPCNEARASERRQGVSRALQGRICSKCVAKSRGLAG